MAKIPGAYVRWDLSPRILYLPIPIDEATIQDIYDTAREIEDEPYNLKYDSLISAAGKESLGGGVFVGLTATLNNVRLAFQGRKSSNLKGTITTADADGRLLIDSSGTFVSSAIEPGAWVVNCTTGAVASVISVDSETQITVDILEDGDGGDNAFNFGDRYRLQNVVQCSVAGGNLVALDAGAGELDPILPTVGTQVVRTSSSSATLQELQDIQYSSFGGGVTVDVTSSYSGTGYPVGTPRQPVNNLQDALAIASSRGFTRFFVMGDLTINGGLNFTGYIFEGESESKSAITIDPSANTLRCEFLSATISGTLDGGSLITDCQINTINYIDGFIERCILNGPITLSGGGTAHFLDCFSGVPGTSTPIIDMAGSGSALALRNYNGGIRLENKTGTDAVSIDMNSGQIQLASSVTNGTIVCRGVGKLLDESNGATVINELITSQAAQFSNYDGVVRLDVVAGVAGTAYPVGTGLSPSNNLADAKSIAASLGIAEIVVTGTLVLGPTDSVDFLTITGKNSLADVVVVSPGCSTLDAVFRDMTLTGTMGGPVLAEKCALVNVVNIGSDSGPSLFNECVLIEGTFSFANGLTTPGNVQFTQCVSGVKSGAGVVIDYNGTTTKSAFRRHSGSVTLTNHSANTDSVWEFETGDIEIAASCTAGTITIRGLGEVTDNSAGTTVINELVSVPYIADGVLDESLAGHAIPGSVGEALSDIGVIDYSTSVLQYMNGFVYIDAVNGSPGTVIGTNGTVGNPVDNLADALTIAESIGLRSFLIVSGSITLDRAYTEWQFVGRDEAEVLLSGQNVNGSTFEGCLVKGAMTGKIVVMRGQMEDVSGFLGSCHDSGIFGTISLGVGKSTFHECFSEQPGQGAPTLDFVGAGRSVNFRSYSGGIQLENMTDVTNTVTIEHVAGQVILDASCTNGVAVLRGTHKVTDNSNGTLVDREASHIPAEVRRLLNAILGNVV